MSTPARVLGAFLAVCTAVSAAGPAEARAAEPGTPVSVSSSSVSSVAASGVAAGPAATFAFRAARAGSRPSVPTPARDPSGGVMLLGASLRAAALPSAAARSVATGMPASAGSVAAAVPPGGARPSAYVTNVEVWARSTSWTYGSAGAVLYVQVHTDSPAGAVLVYDRTTLLARLPVTKDLVTYRLPSRLAVGTHELSVLYAAAGERPDLATWTTGTVKVRPRQSMSLSRSRTTYRRGTTGALLSVRMSAAPKRARGTVTFYVGTQAVAKRSVPASGKVSYRLPSWLAPRRHAVSAVFTPARGTGLRSMKRSSAVIVAPRTRTLRVASRKLTSVSGKGSTSAAVGADVEHLGLSYLSGLRARGVTLRWNAGAADCRDVTARSRGQWCIRGYVRSDSTAEIHLWASGNFASADARRDLRFVVAHEYSHVLQVRIVGRGRIGSFQSRANSEKQADCMAAILTGMSVRSFGGYTRSCTGKLGATARQMVRGVRPASLGW